jgi:lysyl-tRNA synthetase class 2
MNIDRYETKYNERKEKITKADRWFSLSDCNTTGEPTKYQGRILKMHQLSEGRGIQFLLFTQDKNVSLFFSTKNENYSDFKSLVGIGDVLVITTNTDSKGPYAIDFMIAAICITNTEDLNYFNHNAENYISDAFHKRVCGSRSEIESYKTMSITLESLHSTMQKNRFLQVLTPTLDKQYRGGYARPFITHSNHLRKDVYLRVTAEIQHKQLIVGGIERLYELVLSFRNESASQTSRNAFNLVEVEAAYSNEDLMFVLLHDFIETSCNKMGVDIPAYRQMQYGSQMLFDITGKTVETIGELAQVEPYSRLGEDAFKLCDYRLANLILKRFIIPSCQGLTIIQDLKQNYSPFVKKSDKEVFRWFVIWNGYKIAEIYRSETDANIIRNGIIEICNNSDRSLVAYDNYFHSQYTGMPPVATMSIGIERIIMILCNKDDLHKVFE